MAKQYYATNRIKHGDGGVETVFEPGDLVTGLTKEAMVALWNNGALTEVDPDEAQAKEQSLQDKIADLEKQLAEARASADAPPDAGDAPSDDETVEEEAPPTGEEAPPAA